ncbi:MAG: histidine kinase [Desulfatitalea sp. BRH_c12]|nr:MAG: histidine kinase [Desulfatitalea sp. BRH_c12]
MLRGANVAIVGGGRFCFKLLRFFIEQDLAPQKPTIIGVADIRPDAAGMVYARSQGIYTATDYSELCRFDQLQVILEITNDPDLAAAIQKIKPKHVHLIDHFQARYLWDTIQVESLQLSVSQAFQENKHDPLAVERLFQQSFECFEKIICRRNNRSREIELALIENQRTQSQIIQGSTIPTFVINKAHIVTHWNKALEKMSGWSSEEIVGTNRQWAPFWERERPTMADVILDQTDEAEIRSLYGSQWRASALIEGACEAEIFFPQVGEEGRWLWFTAAPLKLPDGTIVGAIETLWDKTEDKKAEEERERLREQYVKSEEKYRSLFNNDPNPIFIVARDTLQVLDINDRVRECYGYGRGELEGMSFLQLGTPQDGDIRNGIVQLPIGQSILFSKRRHYRKNGTPFFVNINVSDARYGESDVLIATTTDITETVEKETQLIQASKMTTLGVMAAGMAHEINQPLNVIQICADFFLKMLDKGQSIQEDDLRAMAHDISANVERASGIIKHVRDFARQSEVLKSKINLNDPIADVFKVLGHQIKNHRIEMILDFAPDLPPIMGDHNRLEQVFINLVSNAIDAMDEKAEQPEHKSMTKRLRIRTYAENANVVAAVEDNGIGMSPEVQKKLFEPFFTTKQVGKGTGLGVSISYGIIKDYDGRIDIESRAGEGTVFILTFPVAGR